MSLFCFWAFSATYLISYCNISKRITVINKKYIIIIKYNHTYGKIISRMLLGQQYLHIGIQEQFFLDLAWLVFIIHKYVVVNVA